MFTRMRGWQCESEAVKSKSGTGDRITDPPEIRQR